MTSRILYTQINEENDRKVILREYRALLKALKERLKKGDRKLVRRAFEMAVDAHKEMRRKSGEPYILHPIAVARITVEEIGLGVTSAICALLHDVVEDTEITLEDISAEFGSTYAHIIDGLTKISNVVDFKNGVSMQAENFRKVLLTLAEDPRVILIKLADRLHNMRTLNSMSRDKQMKIASETNFIYAPLAHRLGLYEIKSELEDLSLKYTQPDVYLDIAKKLKETKNNRTKYIKEFIKPIKAELEAHGFKFEIFGRPKSVNSIYNKMRTKGVAFEEVFDLFAIRIILDTEREKEKEDCWRVYSIITNFYHPSPERLRDWISVPKGNGYEALHTTVMGPAGRWVEVQIRSKRMNEIAEKGLAAHWKYKEGTQSESKLDDFLKHIGEILSSSDADSLDFLQDFKLDLFTKEIYVYTRTGEMRVLPKGATAIDLAFDIHSELGARCIGAKVNYKLVPISYVLRSGDQVEIITSSKQKPSEDWLQFAVTGKAKSRIKYYLKEEKRKIAEDGKAAIERKLNHLGLKLSTHNVNEMSSYFGFNNSLDLYYAAAVGSIELGQLKNFIINGDKFYQPVVPKTADESVKNEPLFDFHPNPKAAKDSELIIFGESSDKVLYKLATCCQPIPGDAVFGFITSGEGLKIHRYDCPNAQSMLANFAHRVVKIKWAKNKEISFLTGVRIIGLDDVGIVQGITNIITTEMNINMRSISIDSQDGVFDGTIKVFVKDKEELDLLCSKLETIPGVEKVLRLEEGQSI
ncbi:MAG TPA: bifunctional (p)ppGpp synthetase/guanosine-3',5'-bis(diphosphate) 3'-pyrophosphohydrolase [Edaphocola sp.]|nr:bifunctional (p)ppGpp synthetase/guanosine-3',5'-bis(diphosphate) 3'-pyrophosphohydrolase [Edaphocola sp.]